MKFARSYGDRTIEIAGDETKSNGKKFKFGLVFKRISFLNLKYLTSIIEKKYDELYAYTENMYSLKKELVSDIARAVISRPNKVINYLRGKEIRMICDGMGDVEYQKFAEKISVPLFDKSLVRAFVTELLALNFDYILNCISVELDL